MILKFHIQNYLDKSKKWYTWHSLAANFTYRTLKSGLDLQCSAFTSKTPTSRRQISVFNVKNSSCFQQGEDPSW